MRLWRIAANVPGEYLADDLRGEGARRNGARWNSVGVPAIYAAFAVATAVLESLAHLGGRKPPRDRYLVAVEIPDRLFDHPQHGIQRFPTSALPALWNAQPAHQVSQLWGDARLLEVGKPRGKATLPPIGFAVPSVLVEEENNVVLNPRHPLVKKHVTATVVRAFAFDHRLVLHDRNGTR
jgi:RES domain-containing protein